MAGFLEPKIPERHSAAPPEGLLHAIQQRRERIGRLREELGASLPSVGPLVVELGCGHGHWLCSFAAAHPDTACLGVDVMTRRIQLAEAKRVKRGLANLRFRKAEAIEVLEALPEPERLRDLFILFPDPWPKQRHYKNRLIQTNFLDLLASRFSESLRLFFRTDETSYFEWSREHLEEHPAWRIDDTFPWPHEHESYFQDLMDSWQSLVAVRDR